MNRKFIFVISLIVILIIGIVFIFIFRKPKSQKSISVNKGRLIAEFDFKELNLNLAGEDYQSKSPFEKELAPGKYKLKATKEYYQNYEREITIEAGRETKIKIDLEIQPAIKKQLNKKIAAYVKENAAPSIKFEINNLKIEDGKAEALIVPVSVKLDIPKIILEKKGSTWQVTYFGTDY